MTRIDGDPDLVARATRVLGPRHRVVGVASVVDGVQRIGALGAGAGADFEIGSLSKGITGLLYADAVDRGEVTPASTLGDHLDLGPSPVARVTLAALSVHASGLPRLAAGPGTARRTWELWRRGANPYREDVPTLLDQARRTRLGRPRPRYSNLGFELLGHALAVAAGTTYPALVRDRIAEPLGLTATYVPEGAAELRPQAVTGTNRRGRRTQPWISAALGPAGGIRASPADLARLTAALLDGSAPGIQALNPVAPFRGNLRIGAAWLTLSSPRGDVTWHNGATGGFCSWLGLDRERGRGLAVVSATSRSLDRAGFELLAGLRPATG